MRRIGFLGGGTVALQPIYNGLLQGMRELGYREGRDFVVEWRLAEGQYERFAEFAAEMVRLWRCPQSAFGRDSKGFDGPRAHLRQRGDRVIKLQIGLSSHQIL